MFTPKTAQLKSQSNSFNSLTKLNQNNKKQTNINIQKQQNIVKINFTKNSRLLFKNNADQKQHQQQNKKQRYLYDICDSGQQIDPWNTQNMSGFNVYGVAGNSFNLKSILDKNKNKDKKEAMNLGVDGNKRKTNWQIINRAAITTHSWNQQRTRRNKVRKQMHLPIPIFQTDQNQQRSPNNDGKQANINQQQDRTLFDYLKKRRKFKQQINQSKSNNSKNGELTAVVYSQSQDKFQKHKKLLSRIFTYNNNSNQPKILVKRYENNKHQDSNQNIQCKSFSVNLSSSSNLCYKQKLIKAIQRASYRNKKNQAKRHQILYNFQSWTSSKNRKYKQQVISPYADQVVDLSLEKGSLQKINIIQKQVQSKIKKQQNSQNFFTKSPVKSAPFKTNKIMSLRKDLLNIQ